MIKGFDTIFTTRLLILEKQRTLTVQEHLFCTLSFSNWNVDSLFLHFFVYYFFFILFFMMFSMFMFFFVHPNLEYPDSRFNYDASNIWTSISETYEATFFVFPIYRSGILRHDCNTIFKKSIILFGIWKDIFLSSSHC